MINRQNYIDVKAYIRYLVDIRQVQTNTSRVVMGRLNHLLVYADNTPFTEFGKIKPSFQAYMEKVTCPDGKLLSASHLASVFKSARGFLTWAKREWPTRYKSLDHNLVEAIRPSRSRNEYAVLVKREIYTLDDVIKLVSVPTTTTNDRRNRAAAAFLFLSGMRITAFLSMPIQAFDIQNWSVRQLPELGVKTKNSKAAITYLLNIPILRSVVKEWDEEVRSTLPATANWYAVLDPWGYLSDRKRNTINSRVEFRKALISLCEKAGLPYLSSHKFRHGHAVYALKKATSMAQMKAISQNLMHSNMGITDGIYGRLVNNDVRDIVQDL